MVSSLPLSQKIISEWEGQVSWQKGYMRSNTARKVVYHKGVRKGCEYLHTRILYIVIHYCNINNASAIHNYSKESLPLIISYIEVILWWTSLHKQEENITE